MLLNQVKTYLHGSFGESARVELCGYTKINWNTKYHHKNKFEELSYKVAISE